MSKEKPLSPPQPPLPATFKAFIDKFPALGIAVASIPLLVPHGPARRTATQELRALSSAFADRLK